MCLHIQLMGASPFRILIVHKSLLFPQLQKLHEQHGEAIDLLAHSEAMFY